MNEPPDPYEKEIERMGDAIRANAGFVILFVLGVLHLAKKVTFDWPVIAVFGIALLPPISRLIETFKVGKDGAEMKMRTGSKPASQVEKAVTPQTEEPPVSKSTITEPTSAALPEARTGSFYIEQFRSLDPESRKILRTLWRYQQKLYKNDFSTRWTFAVLPNSTAYPNYLKGLGPLIEKGLVAVPQNQCALADQGIVLMENLPDEDGRGDFYVY